MLAKSRSISTFAPTFQGDVAQLVEQRTENPCVGGSIPSITTTLTQAFPIGKAFFVSCTFKRALHILIQLTLPNNSMRAYYYTNGKYTAFGISNKCIRGLFWI